MPHRLSSLMLNRVDLVPDGANPDAHIVLFKSQEEPVTRKAKKKVPAKKADSRSKSKQRGDEEEDEEDDDVIAKTEDDDEEDEENEEDESDDDIEKSDDDDEEDEEEESDDVDDEDDDEPTTKSKGKGKKNSANNKSKKTKPSKTTKKKVVKASENDDEDDLADEDDEDDIDEVPESVMKALPRAAQSFFEKMNVRIRRVNKSAREAKEMAIIEKTKRERLEYIEKAKTAIPNLTGTDEEKGDMFMALYSGLPIEKSMAKQIVKLLKTGDAAVQQLMTETGQSPNGDLDDEGAVKKLREKAKEIQKADSKLTREQAFEKACQQNPKLFSEYRLEKSRERRVM